MLIHSDDKLRLSIFSVNAQISRQLLPVSPSSGGEESVPCIPKFRHVAAFDLVNLFHYHHWEGSNAVF